MAPLGCSPALMAVIPSRRTLILGVLCHSDLHRVRNAWQKTMPTVYACVPCHEIVGRVVKAGSAVRRFKEGDLAAVGKQLTCPEEPHVAERGGESRVQFARPSGAAPTTHVAIVEQEAK